MGDVGNDGDNVDERLWDKDDDLEDVRIHSIKLCSWCRDLMHYIFRFGCLQKQELGDSQSKAETKDITNPEYDQGNNDRSDSEQADDLKNGQKDAKETESPDEGVLEENNLPQEDEYQDELPSNDLEEGQNNLELPSDMEIEDGKNDELNEAMNEDEGVEEEIEEQVASIHEENTQSDAEGHNSEDIVDIPVDDLNAKSEEHSAEAEAGGSKDNIDDRGTPFGDGNQSLIDQECVFLELCLYSFCILETSVHVYYFAILTDYLY